MKIFARLGIFALVLGSMWFAPTSASATRIPLNPDYPLVKPFCWGAGAAAFNCPPQTSILFNPNEHSAFPPKSPTCIQDKPGEYNYCVIGDTTSAKKIAVVGSSHGRLQWLAFDAIGEREGIAFHLFFKNSCHYMVTSDVACNIRNLTVRSRLRAGEFDLVIFSGGVDRNEDGREIVSATNYLTYYNELRLARVQYVVIKDNPTMYPENLACLKKNKKNPTLCTIDRDDAFRYRDFAVEAATTARAPVLDFSDFYCDETTCPLVRGGMLMYRDLDHLYPVFTKTLAPFMWTKMYDLGLLPIE